LPKVVKKAILIGASCCPIFMNSSKSIIFVTLLIMDRAVTSKLPQIRTLCKEHKVRELYVFGSRGKGGSPKENSDFDLLVEIDESDPIIKGHLLLNLYLEFEKLFKSKVDLVTPESIKNPIFEEYIGTSKQLIYDGSKN
jgi:predicted nucleotidyltransferase